MSPVQLIGHEIFGYLRPEQVEAISAEAEEIRLEAGDTVFRQGEKADYVFVVIEGQVALRLARPDGLSVLIEEANNGVFFGSCVCLNINRYTLTARCTTKSRILRIKAESLKKVMDRDPVMGYAIQASISKTYFLRYVETMRKLQSIIQDIPLEPA